MPGSLCLERNLSRTDRRLSVPTIRRHVREVRRSLRGLRGEGFRTLHHLTSPEEVDAAVVRRRRLWNDHRDLRGPFDIVGDVHGCCDELEELLALLGYVPGDDGVPRHPDGRIAVFLGDLVDRGPRILDTVGLVRRMVAAGSARCRPRQPRPEAPAGPPRPQRAGRRTGSTGRSPRSRRSRRSGGRRRSRSS